MSPIYTFFSSLFSPLFLYFIFYITHFIIRSSTILLIKSFILLSYHFHHPILYPVIFSFTYSFPGFLFFFFFHSSVLALIYIDYFFSQCSISCTHFNIDAFAFVLFYIFLLLRYSSIASRYSPFFLF